MNTNSKLPEIRKEAFIKAREKLKLSCKDLAGMACLSPRQIEQIENGEISSFYNPQIKVTAAKKVAKLLKLSDEEVFDFGATTPETSDVVQIIPEVKLTDAPEIEVAKIDAIEIQEQAQESQLLVEEKKVQAKQAPLNQTSSKPKSTSPKNRFFWLGVAAAAIFAAINLQPLFSSKKPVDIPLAKEEVIESLPATSPVEPVPAVPAASVAETVLPPVLPAPVVLAEATAACPAEEGIISFKTDAPLKAADRVHVKVKSKQVVCVSDASGKIQNSIIEPSAGISFYGKPPFKVLTGGLSQADVFFQGKKVRLTNPNYKTLILEAAEVLAPSIDRIDVQQR